MYGFNERKVPWYISFWGSSKTTALCSLQVGFGPSAKNTSGPSPIVISFWISCTFSSEACCPDGITINSTPLFLYIFFQAATIWSTVFLFSSSTQIFNGISVFSISILACVSAYTVSAFKLPLTNVMLIRIKPKISFNLFPIIMLPPMFLYSTRLLHDFCFFTYHTTALCFNH